MDFRLDIELTCIVLAKIEVFESSNRVFDYLVLLN